MFIKSTLFKTVITACHYYIHNTLTTRLQPSWALLAYRLINMQLLCPVLYIYITQCLSFGPRAAGGGVSGELIGSRSGP